MSAHRDAKAGRKLTVNTISSVAEAQTAVSSDLRQVEIAHLTAFRNKSRYGFENRMGTFFCRALIGSLNPGI